METEPSPIEAAAQDLRRPGAVKYWTDYLKVRFPSLHGVLNLVSANAGRRSSFKGVAV